MIPLMMAPPGFQVGLYDTGQKSKSSHQRNELGPISKPIVDLRMVG